MATTKKAKTTTTETETVNDIDVKDIVDVVDSIEDEPFEEETVEQKMQKKYPNATIEKKGSIVVICH